MSRFDTSWDGLRTARDRAFGVKVTYRRGDVSIRDLSVKRSGVGKNPALEHLLISGAIKIYEVDVCDLVIGNKISEPKRGDVIEEANGSRYRVTDMDGENAWEWTDGNETGYRFSAQKIK